MLLQIISADCPERIKSAGAYDLSDAYCPGLAKLFPP